MALVLALMTFWSMSLPASARPSDESQPVPLDLADRDGDRISDGLTADLKNRGPNERVDVVVTWTRRPDIEAARRAAGHFDVSAQFGVVNGFAASLNAGQIRALSKIPGVFRVEEDFQVSILNDEANADFGTTQARADFPATGAGAGVVFCVVDTGVDRTHEQLDGNKVVAWRDIINGQLTAYDDQGHGTHVASILGGDGVGGPDASRYQGVAPGVSIAAVKVLNSAGTGSESQVIQGIDWCIAQQVDGISMSLGDPAFTDGNDALSQAVDRAVLNHGIVSVIAAGNSGDGPGTVGSPGAARQALTVGAATKVADGLRLAGFSSRGPTLDGRLKPEVVSPGVAITAANANTGSGYFAASGTSMATPFTAGVVALMLGCNGLLTPSQIKSALGSTATDLGPAGPDNSWGNGLIDGYQAVASACGGSGGMALPTHNHVQGTVPNGGTYTHRFTVGTDGLGKPISATILIQGQLICTFEFWGMCFIWEWSPDIEARLVGPANNELWINECPARGECGTVGQTEVITATANQAGEYRIEVWAVTDPPNNGLGGGFVMDLFYGPVGGAPPPPTNNPPVAGNDSYSTNEDTPLSVLSPGVLGNDTDPNGDVLTAAVVTGPTAGTLALNADGSFTYTPNPNFNGADSFVYRASDGRGGTADATASITISAVNDPPVANAGPDQTVTDTDGSGTQAVTLNGTGSTDLDGDSLTYSWSEGATLIETGASPTVSLTVGSHTLTLTVNDGTTDATDLVTITVQPQSPPANNPPVAGNDSYSTNEDTPLSVVLPGVLGNDTDPNGDVLTAAVVTGPTAGALVLNADGSFTYTPNPNFNGADSFAYQASDGKGGTSQATVALTVNAVNDPPVANAGPDQTVTDTDGSGSQAVTLNGIGSTDLDGDSLTYSWSEGATVLGTGASLSVSLTEGTHTVTLTVNDGSASATDPVTITVQPQQPPYTTIHVADLDRTSTWNARRTKWTATVTVTVHNAGHILVSGAKVFFSLGDGTARSCTTGTNGACVVSKDKAANVLSLTFTVTNLTRNGQTHAPGSNHDPDGDSNGTAITVTRPS